MKATVLLAVAIAMASTAALAQKGGLDTKLPRVVNGKVVDPLVAGPAPTTYPRIENKTGNDPRLQINKDVSLGGNVTKDSVSGNIRVPLPEKK